MCRAGGCGIFRRPAASEELESMHDAHPRGFEAVSQFLTDRDLAHAVVEHPETYTAASEARVAAVPPQHTAKTVMVRDDTGYVLAVIPASELLDVRKLRRLALRPLLRLATEDEMAADFPAFDVGALPPFGALFGCPEFIDQTLVAARRVLCNGGDHRHSIVLDAHELRRASRARIGDLVVDHPGANPEIPARATRPSAR
jgi:Ala-tRNA(Pro) deacylase